MSSLQFYLLFVLIPNAGIFLSVISAFLALGGVFYLISLSEEKGWPANDKKMRNSLRWTVSWIIMAIALAIFVPTKKEMAGIVGIPYLTQIKNIDKVPSSVVNKLLEVLKENKPGKKDE